jgi:hypothetical protein
MQLPKEEAFVLAKKLYEENPCRAHNRFGSNFEWYYNHRLKTEKWLYEKFVELGGKPQTPNPFYFLLHKWEKYNEYYDSAKIIKISLKEIDMCDISFTFGDSCWIMDAPDKKEPFLKNSLMEYIALNDNDIDKFLDNSKRQCGLEDAFVEAQIWTDIYFNDYQVL